uniref:Uncharacterized protein n=1 Tax=Dulem virus 36 TaxID=3145754 RepID=A0AAU8B0A0_9CAUD
MWYNANNNQIRKPIKGKLSFFYISFFERDKRKDVSE